MKLHQPVWLSDQYYKAVSINSQCLFSLLLKVCSETKNPLRPQRHARRQTAGSIMVSRSRLPQKASFSH